jgi:anthranilate phosphoribosyltransferase
VNVNLTPEQVAQCVDEIGVGFMFAPNHHSAMKHAAPVRRELGVRTMFNLLGPLTNPAGAQNQVLGVFSRELTAKLAHVLSELGSQHVLVVHGSDGLDEITISGASNIAELKNGKITEYTVQPADFGLQEASLDAIRVTNTDEAKTMLLSVLDNQPNAAHDIVLLNAGAAIYVAGLSDSLANGINTASQVIASGAAKAKLAQLISISQRAAA